MHQQQTPSPLTADVARLGVQAADAAVEHRDHNPAKAAAAQAAAGRASDFLRRHGDDRLTTLERIKLVMPWVSPASLVELQKVHDEVAALIAARDELQAKLNHNRCHNGHETLPLVLWDCPECHQRTRDKLAEATKSLEHIVTLTFSLRENGPAPEDLDDLSNALIDATDTAHITLARIGGA